MVAFLFHMLTSSSKKTTSRYSICVRDFSYEHVSISLSSGKDLGVLPGLRVATT